MLQTGASLKCYTSIEMSKDKKNPEDFKKMMKVRQYLELNNKQNQYFLGEGSFGTVMSLPWDSSKMVKAIIISQKKNDPFLNEIYVTHHMSQQDNLQVEDPRFAPRIYKIMCIDRSRGDRMILMFGERFMGDMARAIEKDKKFMSNMLHMGNRMSFYHKILRAFKFIFHSGYKHCDIKPDNILYSIQNGTWNDQNKRVVNVGEKPEYFPVFTDFGLTVSNDVNCKGGTLMFMVPAEANKQMEYFDKYRKRAELFAIGLTLLWMDVNLMSNLFEFPRDSVLHDLLGALEGSNGSVQINMGTTTPIKKNKLYKILDKIMHSVGYMNNGENKNYSYKKLETDLKYVRNCLLVFFKYYMSQIYPVSQLTFKNRQIDAIDKMAQWYKEYLDFIISMCRSNDMINGRPGVTDSINFLTQKAADFTELHDAVTPLN